MTLFAEYQRKTGDVFDLKMTLLFDDPYFPAEYSQKVRVAFEPENDALRPKTTPEKFQKISKIRVSSRRRRF